MAQARHVEALVECRLDQRVFSRSAGEPSALFDLRFAAKAHDRQQPAQAQILAQSNRAGVLAYENPVAAMADPVAHGDLFKGHGTVGQRAGLVETDDVDGGEGLDRGKASDEDAVA